MRMNAATTSNGIWTSSGAIAQLGERLPCTQEVCGSIPHGSTKIEFCSLKIRSEKEAVTAEAVPCDEVLRRR